MLLARNIFESDLLNQVLNIDFSQWAGKKCQMSKLEVKKNANSGRHVSVELD